MIYLTEKEKEILVKAVNPPNATIWQIIRCMWWAKNNDKKIRIIIDSLVAGMSWKFTYKKAKENKNL